MSINTLGPSQITPKTSLGASPGSGQGKLGASKDSSSFFVSRRNRASVTSHALGECLPIMLPMLAQSLQRTLLGLRTPELAKQSLSRSLLHLPWKSGKVTKSHSSHLPKVPSDPPRFPAPPPRLRHHGRLPVLFIEAPAPRSLKCLPRPGAQTPLALQPILFTSFHIGFHSGILSNRLNQLSNPRKMRKPSLGSSLSRKQTLMCLPLRLLHHNHEHEGTRCELFAVKAPTGQTSDTKLHKNNSLL